jgi:hypothetical protein
MANSYFLRKNSSVTLNVEGKRETIHPGTIVFGNHDYFSGFPGFQYLPGYQPKIAEVAPAAPGPQPELREIFPNFRELDNYELQTLQSIETPPVIDMQSSTKQPEGERKTNLDVLDKLRTLSNKEWFGITLEDAVRYLTDAGIEYSHLPPNRWDYIKFLKTVLKENPK